MVRDPMPLVVWIMFLNIMTSALVIFFIIKPFYPITITFIEQESIREVFWEAILFLLSMIFLIGARIQLTFSFNPKYSILTLLYNSATLLILSVVFMSLAGEALGRGFVILSTMLFLLIACNSIFLYMIVNNYGEVPALVVSILFLMLGAYGTRGETPPIIHSLFVLVTIMWLLSITYMMRKKKPEVPRVINVASLVMHIITFLCVLVVAIIFCLTQVLTSLFRVWNASTTGFYIMILSLQILTLFLFQKKYSEKLSLRETVSLLSIAIPYNLISISPINTILLLSVITIKLYSTILNPYIPIAILWLLNNSLIVTGAQMNYDIYRLERILKRELRRRKEVSPELLKEKFRAYEPEELLNLGYTKLVKEYLTRLVSLGIIPKEVLHQLE